MKFSLGKYLVIISILLMPSVSIYGCENSYYHGNVGTGHDAGGANNNTNSGANNGIIELQIANYINEKTIYKWLD